MKLKILLFSLVSMLALPAMAQEDMLKDFPGYVDFGDLNGIFGEPSVQISVGGALLGLVSTFSASENPEAAELFKRLHGVRVNVYENASISSGAVDYVKDISSKLSQRGWESVVTVNSDDEQVRIFMKINGEEIEGITVMALEVDEAVFVNVIGNLRPDELAQVMDNFDMEMINESLGNGSLGGGGDSDDDPEK
jgi:hypothetical protein